MGDKLQDRSGNGLAPGPFEVRVSAGMAAIGGPGAPWRSLTPLAAFYRIAQDRANKIAILTGTGGR